MKQPKICILLGTLERLDMNAVATYEQAIQCMEEPFVANQLKVFQKQHQHRADELAQLIRELGGQPEDPRRPSEIAGQTSMRTIAGSSNMGSALATLQANEQLIEDAYKEALKTDLPERVLARLWSFYEDEHHHLEFLQKDIEDQAGRYSVGRGSTVPASSGTPSGIL